MSGYVVLKISARLRVVVAVAAASALAVASALGGSGDAVTTSAAAGSCSKTQATAVVKRLHLGEADFIPNPVYAVLCRSVMGSGSQTMVVSLASGGTSVPFEGWAVFRWAGGTWQLVMQQRNGAQISAAGADIRERVNISRQGDPRCCPSGGSKSRLWHWNGTRFTAGPWKRTTPPKPATKPVTKVHLYYVSSPSYNIWCDVGDEDQVFCVSKTPRRAVTLMLNGTVRICSGPSCFRNNKVFQPGDPVLAYGQQDLQGPYVCKSERIGITCTVNRPGKGYGKGFLINRGGVKRVGP